MEFLIKRTDGDWFSLPKDKFYDVLKPNSIASKPVAGWGDHRIRIPSGIIAFSYEDLGIQIIFEQYTGTKEEARVIVYEILKNIESETKETGEIIEL